MSKKRIFIFFILFCFVVENFNIIAYSQVTKFPDYGSVFLGEDKWENFNRKMFNFNLGLNKYAIKPIHILWTSLMPEYGMDRISGVTNNIEYPIRLISSLIQKDFATSKKETIRFFTNTILGIGGMYDPAKYFFKIEQSNENMEQALVGCKFKNCRYFVLPILSFTCFRGVCGKILDIALNPASYIATPILAMIKACFTVNKSSYLQPLISMIESDYADPYEIAKKIYGLDTFIKCGNFDRVDVLSNLYVPVDDNVATGDKKEALVDVKKSLDKVSNSDKSDKIVKIEVNSEIVIPELLYGGTNIDEAISKDYSAENLKLNADLILHGYNPQTPVVDSMRTALFKVPNVKNSMWNELSIWNRSFNNQIKSSSIQINAGRENYNFRYILQKHKKNSPVAIIYPSVGEGIMSSHSVQLAKLFYEAGYSVVIQGSHFQWEFVKSMPLGYSPGLPSIDSENLRIVTRKILERLSEKSGYNFDKKLFIGTSFGALAVLFVADKEYKQNTLGETRYISICPPIELLYAMKQIDKISQEIDSSSSDLKQKVAATAAKVVKLYNSRDDIDFEINSLPFSEEEGKLITGFIMHQKLSDLVYTIENASSNKEKNDFYTSVNNMNYEDYFQKYLVKSQDFSPEDWAYETSLYSISGFLQNSDNYKIYHSLNDYLTNLTQLKKLKAYSGNKTILLDNGSHLGFLYRNEFIEDLKISIMDK